MNKKIKKLLILTVMFFFSMEFVLAYNIDSNNNPGKEYSGGGNGASGGTVWPTDDTGKALRAVRIRIFRGSTQIASAYYALANAGADCFGSVSNVTLCETPSYNYSSVSTTDGVSCAAGKNINFGCIASNNFASTWSVKGYNGTYLDNYLKDSSYTNLKSILAGMGYNDTNFNNSDIVIVEPATLVKCNNSLYFGTSTAMMKKNISYRGNSNNVCSGNDSHNGTTFFNVFRSMSTALKVSEYDSYQGNDSYTGFGYFKYDVSGMGYVDPDGDLRVEIYVDGTNPKQLITSDSLKFNIRKGYDCNGTIVDEDLSTQHSGFATTTLSTGNYSIEMTEHPSASKYNKKSGENYTCRNVSLTSEGATVSIPYEKGCVIEKTEKNNDGYTITDAIALYNKYGYNGLLNTENPSCSNISCDNQTSNIGCLTGNLQTNISSSNLVCADIIEDINGNAVAFCDNTFSIVNNLVFDGLPITTFYGTSGEFLIKKEEELNLYRIYREGNLAEYISAQNGIATGVANKICYVVSGSTLPETYSPSVSQIDSYLNNEKLISNEAIDPFPNPGPETNGIFDVYVYSKKFNYELNTVFIKKITGEPASSSSNNTISIIGLLSKFKDTTGDIPFKVEYDGKTYTTSSENSCKYILDKKIIDQNLNIEFRIIDTINPFNRPTKSNWSSGSDNSKDNETVQKYIINKTNSYGIKEGQSGQIPIYKITLTPSDIITIRDYNKNNKYDNYEIYCKPNNECMSAFLYDLSNGILKKYGNNRPIETYGILKNKLIITKDS